MISPRRTDFRRTQKGGLAIILALVILMIMTVAALGMASSSIRELTTTGSVLQGSKAAEAADAGLDWVIVWSHKDNVDANATSGTAAGNLANAFLAIRSLGKLGLTGGNQWVNGDPATLAVYIPSYEANAASSGMVFNNNDALVSQNAASGNKVIQKFDLVVRYLGSVKPTLTAGGSGASGGTDPTSKGSEDLLYAVTSQGYASVDIGGGQFVQFRQRRDLIGQQGRAQ